MTPSPAEIHAVVRACGNLKLREIDDAFIFAGADPAWRGPPAPAFSNRQDHARRWIAGIEAHAPAELAKIIRGIEEQIGSAPQDEGDSALGPAEVTNPLPLAAVPADVTSLLDRIVRGLRRSMFPLEYRRPGKATLSFADEYDVQDLFHSQIRPWIKDIRTEEYTPSYASNSTRIDFLLKEHGIVVEIKFVRDGSHAKKVHQELTIDIAHYRAHPDAKALWIVVYDPSGHLKNPEGLGDLTGVHDQNGRGIDVCCYVVGSSGAERVGM